MASLGHDNRCGGVNGPWEHIFLLFINIAMASMGHGVCFLLFINIAMASMEYVFYFVFNKCRFNKCF